MITGQRRSCESLSDNPYVISYWWSFGTHRVSPAVFETDYCALSVIGVTSFTSQGHWSRDVIGDVTIW